MKALQRDDLYSWSSFDAVRNIDFNAYAWIRPEGNVLIDPLEMSAHDQSHLESLGGARTIVVTNSDHTRAAAALAASFGAELIGPAQEKETFPLRCDRWASDGQEILPKLRVFELEGSKTPGELCLLLEDRPNELVLFTGDLIRAHRAGALTLLPNAKLSDREKALASVKRLLAHQNIHAVLVGDGWPIFEDGRRHLARLV